MTGVSQRDVSTIAGLQEHARQYRASAAAHRELVEGMLADAELFEHAAARLAARRDVQTFSDPAVSSPALPEARAREPATAAEVSSAATDDSHQRRPASTITVDQPSTTAKLLDLMAADPDRSWTPAEAAAEVGHPKPESVRKLLSLQVRGKRLLRSEGRYQWATPTGGTSEPAATAAVHSSAVPEAS